MFILQLMGFSFDEISITYIIKTLEISSNSVRVTNFGHCH